MEVPTRIRPGLYLGSFESSLNTPFLIGHNVTHILSVTSKNIRPASSSSSKKKFKHMHISALDTPMFPIMDHFGAAISFIHEARQSGGGVLVHCLAGASRSATIVAAYLMAVEGVTADEALHTLIAVRPCVRPNEGFVSQLKVFELNMDRNWDFTDIPYTPTSASPVEKM